jgi:hypothetical protein
MKNLWSAIAASILTVFALTPPGLAARAAGTPANRLAANAKVPGLTDQSTASAEPPQIAQVSSGTLLVQQETPEAQGNSDNRDDSSADTDNQNSSDAGQNSDSDNGSDSNQNAQADDDGESADQSAGADASPGNGDAADAQTNNGGGDGSQTDNGGDSTDQNSDNAGDSH